MNPKAKLIIQLSLLILVPLIAATITYKVLAGAVFNPADPSNTSQVLVEVTPGMNFRAICNLLEQKGVIRSAKGMGLLAKLRGTDTKAINAGEYELSPSMSPKDVLARLASGTIVQRKVTIIPGVSIWEVGKVVEEAGLVSKADMDAAVVSPQLLIKAGISAKSFEGYLFPETYMFSRPINPEKIIWDMLEQGEKHWPAEYSDQANRLNLERHQILTLASIIEKETGKMDEQPKISSVFHNRLKVGMMLQSDPTVIYGIPNFDGNLKKEHLQTPHAYNTYTNFGLPPGPICNPGEGAIKAALFPEETPYLYFVADGEGGHVFATTLKEHNQNVAKYQLLGGTP